MEFTQIVFLIISVLIMIAAYQIIDYLKKEKIDKERWKVLWANLAASHGFSFTQKIVSVDGNRALAIGNNDGRICLVTLEKSSHLFFKTPVATKVLLIYSCDLVSAELFEDGSTISKTSRMSQAGGLLVGGLLLGPAGALIGGLTGKTVTSAGTVKRIELRLIINDTKRPIYDINFLDSEVNRDSLSFKNAMNLSRHWHGLMEVLIRQADAESKKTVHPKDFHTEEYDKKLHIGAFSVATELEKLNSLRERGILNKDEYEQQKLRVLTGD